MTCFWCWWFRRFRYDANGYRTCREHGTHQHSVCGFGGSYWENVDCRTYWYGNKLMRGVYKKRKQGAERRTLYATHIKGCYFDKRTT